jgi:hypothetical protein
MSVFGQLQDFIPSNQVSQDAARNLFDLTIHVRKRLEERLPAMNLRLIDLDLIAMDKIVLAPRAESAFALHGLAVRPESQQAKKFSIRLDLDPNGEFDRDELEPLVNEIVKSLEKAFYPKVC